MIGNLHIRDGRPSDAHFLAECIMAGMHMYDFEEVLNDDLSDILGRLTSCEERTDTLYTHARTRVGEIDGTPVAALLSYPGELYRELKEKTFREYWPAFFELFSSDDPETGPGEYYLDSLAVLPAFRHRGIGQAMIRDSMQIGISQGFTRIALVADSQMPRLVSLYGSLGFVREEIRHAFGTDFQRMVHNVK